MDRAELSRPDRGRAETFNVQRSTPNIQVTEPGLLATRHPIPATSNMSVGRSMLNVERCADVVGQQEAVWTALS
jgi:hypothetical protein